MWERNQTRLQKERKALERKTRRRQENGERISGRDLARLRRVSGSILKESQYEEFTKEEFYDD